MNQFDNKILVNRGGQTFEKRTANFKRESQDVGEHVFTRRVPQTTVTKCCGAFSKPPPDYDEMHAIGGAIRRAPDYDFCADTLVKLSNGVTAYRLMEPSVINDDDADNLPLIVCLHGLYNSSYMWGDLADLLLDCEHGPHSRVLVFDFYGRGRSPWTGVQCTLDILVTQTRELLTFLKLANRPISLIGYDIGGAVAIGFGAKYPELCASIALISSVGVKCTHVVNETMLKTKYLGEVLMTYRKKDLPEQQIGDFFNTDEEAQSHRIVQKQVDMVQWQIDNTPGYLGAILSSYREFPMQGMHELFLAIGLHPRPVLVMWGAKDTVCPARPCMKLMSSAFANGFVIDIPDCGHNALAEKFDEVAGEMLSFHKLVFDELAAIKASSTTTTKL